MIIEALFAIFTACLNAFIVLRPEWDPELPENIARGILFVRNWDAIMPASELMICCSITLAGFAAVFVWKWLIKLIDWIADIIP